MSGLSALVLVDTKQRVLFYLPSKTRCGRVDVGSRKLARLPIQYIQYFSESLSPSALKRELTIIQYIKAVSILSSSAGCLFCCVMYVTKSILSHLSSVPAYVVGELTQAYLKCLMVRFFDRLGLYKSGHALS